MFDDYFNDEYVDGLRVLVRLMIENKCSCGSQATATEQHTEVCDWRVICDRYRVHAVERVESKIEAELEAEENAKRDAERQAVREKRRAMIKANLEAGKKAAEEAGRKVPARAVAKAAA